MDVQMDGTKASMFFRARDQDGSAHVPMVIRVQQSNVVKAGGEEVLARREGQTADMTADFTFLGFIGLATPGFLLALVIMYVAFEWFGIKVGGLFSPEFEVQPWSWAKFLDFLSHLWLPVLILAIGGTANLIRTLRATMLDELRKPYVTVARAKGLSEFDVLVRYPVRIAINPILSTFGWLLVWFFSGGMVVEIVLNLNTAGPVLWRALMRQDMYTAGAYILIIGTLTALGSLISDILLAVVDPRIRFGGVESA